MSCPGNTRTKSGDFAEVSVGGGGPDERPEQTQHELFGYGSLEERVPEDHPLLPIRAMVDEVLKALNGRFDSLYTTRTGGSQGVWHPTVFTKNRDRLLEGEIAEEFFRVVLRQARRKRYCRTNTSPWMEC